MAGRAVSETGSVESWPKHWCGRWRTDGPEWNLYCGDAGRVLSTLPENRYACVITSPPYYWQRDYKVPGQIGLEQTINGYVKAVCGVMDEVRRVLHRRGVLFLNLGDTYYSGKGKPQGKDPKHNGRRLDMLRVVDASGLGKPKKTLLGMPWRVALEMIDRGWIRRSSGVVRRRFRSRTQRIGRGGRMSMCSCSARAGPMISAGLPLRKPTSKMFGPSNLDLDQAVSIQPSSQPSW